MVPCTIGQELSSLTNNFEQNQNENGMYRKWNNGYLEQAFSVLPQISINGKYGSLFLGLYIHSWPISFNSIDMAVCCLAQWGTSASWGTILEATLNNVSVRVFDNITRDASQPTHIIVYATGTWK